MLAAECLQALLAESHGGEETDMGAVGALLVEEFRFAVVSFLCPKR